MIVEFLKPRENKLYGLIKNDLGDLMEDSIELYKPEVKHTLQFVYTSLAFKLAALIKGHSQADSHAFLQLEVFLHMFEKMRRHLKIPEEYFTENPSEASEQEKVPSKVLSFCLSFSPFDPSLRSIR